MWINITKPYMPLEISWRRGGSVDEALITKDAEERDNQSFRFHHSQKEDLRWKRRQVLHLAREEEVFFRVPLRLNEVVEKLHFLLLTNTNATSFTRNSSLLRVNTVKFNYTRRGNNPGFELKEAFKTRKKLGDRCRISIMNQEDKLKKQKQRFQYRGNAVFSH